LLAEREEEERHRGRSSEGSESVDPTNVVSSTWYTSEPSASLTAKPGCRACSLDSRVHSAVKLARTKEV
jgi:hypothetical protein